MIGKVFPPYSDREVVFFFVPDCRLEQVGKYRRKQGQQQEYHGYDNRKERGEKCGKEQNHHSDHNAADADYPEICHIFHNKGLAAADVHGEQPRHCQGNKCRNADRIQHGDHYRLGIGRNFHSRVFDVEVDQPWQSDIHYRNNKHNDADEKACHVAQVEF